MRFSVDHLKFKALVALDEAAEANGPVPKSFALRFVLAYLCALSDADRPMFDRFWSAATGPVRYPGADEFGRRQTLNACMNGICRSVGCERTTELMSKLRGARGL